MQSSASAGSDATARPRPLQASQSFTRLESATQSPSQRSRASTLQGPPLPEVNYPQDISASPVPEHNDESGDIFASKDGDPVDGDDHADDPLPKLATNLDELPIEIRSLTERFLDSLSAKAHPTPLSIDAVSDLFQDFYVRAETHISTHIATLSSRIGRTQSPSPSVSSKISTTSGRSASGNVRKSSTPAESPGIEQQMLTASEISGRKKARKQLELQRTALEEAVERIVCQKVYEKIYRHRSTDDEERDEKLRSRTAALSLLGIGLRELLVNTQDAGPDARSMSIEKEEEIREWLTDAWNNIQRMNDEKYPLGKLQHLTAAHKSIVDTLSRLFPASSSADEILPTVIYTLIISPPEGLSVISNLHFIQRFRASSKIDGEAAYCLVNLEAAISFLETVDLASLRTDEAPQGQKSNTRPTTPRSENKAPPMNLGLAITPAPGLTPLSVESNDLTVGSNDRALPSPRQTRRLSSLLQTQATRLESATDSVRDSILTSADEAIDSINNTLNESFKFFFGRLREQQTSNDPSKQEVIVPKTLEDARKLVSPRTTGEDDSNMMSATSLVIEDVTTASVNEKSVKPESHVLDLVAGRRPRDRSVDSTQSATSTKGVGAKPPPTSAPSSSTAPAPSAGNAAVESMRNLGNTLNPLKGLSGINMIPRFGRANPVTPAPAQEKDKEKEKEKSGTRSRSGTLTEAKTGQVKNIPKEKEHPALAAIEQLRKTPPPVRRFLEMKDAKDIKLGEVEELLKEYQRLAGAIRSAINAG
ncbi:hypothetical protein M501DRAFT_993976 [Patellaria atrata CBS 101060]|uniref:VPS9 domain-containing protein n=1 Tax=Patellaria atrata CBS 101060 TaxID=1346257 RepID=A0A9P4SHN1_9PEZI|nr:hypothetical protein M501DRAFT_993976 [Patellaria atrata CBS 101060]